MEIQKATAQAQGDSSVRWEIVSRDAGVNEPGSTALRFFVICFNRHGAEHNIIDRSFCLALARVVLLARHKAVQCDVDAVVVCSAKKDSFVAGADISHELLQYSGPGSEQRAFTEARQLQDVLCLLESLPVPTIAIMNGTTLGGGLELALACDYRIADTKSHQIGLPEVKLGVLPGAGGCCRLPRLIGFRNSLSLLLTGNAISTQKALKLGLVDMLSGTLQTVPVACSKESMFDYQWLSLVDNCELPRGTSRQKPLILQRRVSKSSQVGIPMNVDLLTEEKLLEAASENSSNSEEKAAKKYPHVRRWFPLLLHYFLNTIVYFIALFQLWRTVGLRMPAPYVCLQTSFRCLFTSSWVEAMTINALGFATLVSTAESKSLMSLFILTRKMKKQSLTFGGQVNQKQQVFDPENTAVVVTVSKRGLGYSSAFIQGLLYSNLNVHTLAVDTQCSMQQLHSAVLKHFEYSLRRRHLNESDVKGRLRKLHYHGNVESLKRSGKDFSGKVCILVNAAYPVDRKIMDNLKDLIKTTYTEVVFMDLVYSMEPPCLEKAIALSAGDPVRKNTLCVELQFCIEEVDAKCIRTAASFISAYGKIPVVNPYTKGDFCPSLASDVITASHWCIAARVVNDGVLKEKEVDSCLLSAGYSRGPFDIIRKLDPTYVHHIIHCGDVIGINPVPLTNYLKGCKAKTIRDKIITQSDIADLITLHCIKTALCVKRLYPLISDTKIDVLFVMGLVQFPPSDGGPLNLLAREGGSEISKRLISLECKHLCGKFTNELEPLRAAIRLGEDKKLFSVGDEHEGVAKESKISDKDLIVFSANQLQQIGSTKGVVNNEVFLFPLPAILCMITLGLIVVLLLLIII